MYFATVSGNISQVKNEATIFLQAITQALYCYCRDNEKNGLLSKLLCKKSWNLEQKHDGWKKLQVNTKVF